jgi:hypothetical protein
MGFGEVDRKSKILFTSTNIDDLPTSGGKKAMWPNYSDSDRFVFFFFFLLSL